MAASSPRRISTKVPTYDALITPTIQALTSLGGSGTIDEIFRKVTEILNLPETVLQVSHSSTGQSEVEYRLAWARTYLRKVGLVEPSSRGVWAISAHDIDLSKIDPKEIVRQVRAMSRNGNDNAETTDTAADNAVEPEITWREHLRKTLLAMQPSAFERLVQRLLRESGFVQVEVTGRSGDGGIDGIGIARVAGFLSFNVLFQCKRYQGAVTPSQVRDFRGAMQGRTDKGLIITTGSFTREAVKEATRDGAPPIDLIDGEQLADRLKEYRLGIRVEMVESASVDNEWFERL